MTRNGYSVLIRRQDGSEFLASSVNGVLPPVWPLGQRKHAVTHKNLLKVNGFHARVVRVQFADVVVVEKEMKE